MAEVLDAKEVPDHAPIFVQMSSSLPRPQEDISTPKPFMNIPSFELSWRESGSFLMVLLCPRPSSSTSTRG
eukprot:2089893-Pyramimonas_sp.AAC.1